jgi:hypothetical protein
MFLVLREASSFALVPGHLAWIQKRNGLAGISAMGGVTASVRVRVLTAEAEALDAHSRARMSARISDISRGGCYVDTFCRFPRNSSVKIRVVRDNQPMVADAKVVYSKFGMGMGLSFSGDGRAKPASIGNMDW